MTVTKEQLVDWEDPQVQAVYAILCDDVRPPKGEHWEGFAARRIVAALRQFIEQSQDRGHAPAPSDELHQRIMNLPCDTPAVVDDMIPVTAFRMGFKAARHAAAELVSSALAAPAPAPAQQPTPAGVNKVAIDLLREVVGPLEVSAAVIESEDGNETIETLLTNIKRFVEQFDRAALSPQPELMEACGMLYECLRWISDTQYARNTQMWTGNIEDPPNKLKVRIAAFVASFPVAAARAQEAQHPVAAGVKDEGGLQ